MKIKTIIFLLTATVITSCKQFYDYNVNYDGNKLVVNGTIEANVGVTVSLSQSQSPSGLINLENFTIKNGRVWLYQNDTLIAEMVRNSIGKYTIDKFKPHIGQSYRIKAVADGLDTAKSESVVVPSLPSINTFVLKKDNSYVVNQNKSAAFFSADIKDWANEKNFYLLNSYVQIRSDSTYSGFLKGLLSDLSTCEFDAFANLIFFTDKCFDGNNYTIDYFSEHTNKGTLKIELSAIDKNFSTYLRSREQPTGLELGFSEPKLATSNIKNGYGVFVAKSTQTFSLKLD